MSATVHIVTVSPAWRVVGGEVKPIEIIDVKATVVVK